MTFPKVRIVTFFSGRFLHHRFRQSPLGTALLGIKPFCALTMHAHALQQPARALFQANKRHFHMKY
jgi:hypothetical protein